MGTVISRWGLILSGGSSFGAFCLSEEAASSLAALDVEFLLILFIETPSRDYQSNCLTVIYSPNV